VRYIAELPDAIVLGAFSVLAIALTAIGVFAVVAGVLETLLLSGCVVALVGILAAYLPIRRIARLDPVTVLRAE
jgi:ABC-type antimicrobial peptide transport system permease subunit